MNTLSNVETVERLKTADNKREMLKEILGSDFEDFMKEVVSEDHTKTQKVDSLGKILSLKGKGLATGAIKAYIKEIDDVQVTQTEIANALEQVRPLMIEWTNRTLSKVYPIVYLDAMYFHVRENGKTSKKSSYHMIGINTDGMKELLGIWVADSEGAKFWTQTLGDIKARGVDDILIACIDGLKGLPEAIEAVFPQTSVQLCINHMTRNTTKSTKNFEKKEFYADLKEIYSAPTEEAGLEALHMVQKKWPAAAAKLNRWEKEWGQVSTFFSYSPVVRRLIYTTNHVESLHSQFRRVTNATNVFASPDHLRMTLWLAQREITSRWIQPISDWGEIIAQLTIAHPERIDLF